MQLFADKSFDEVTLNDICEKSGINKQTFYYYFKSKDNLLDSYYNISYQLKTDDLSNILTADSYVEQLWLINRPMIDFIENAGLGILRRIFITNMTKNIGTFGFSQEKRQLLRLQKQIIEKGQDCGQFHSDVDAGYLAFLFHQMIISSAIFWSMSDGDFAFRDHLRYSYEQIFNVDGQYRTMADFRAHYALFD